MGKENGEKQEEKGERRKFILLATCNIQPAGYNTTKSASILGLLAEKTTREPVTWTEKEKLFEYVPN